MNTFANGLTCSTFVGKTVHFSVAIYNRCFSLRHILYNELHL